ncbi:sensor domain-containing diguanylate cyclase [Aureimonas pseudogalii]|uniref:sensor domain-containing diguanylate cyclase n=1 Tax=Aureimonas pseudogalii TaxID=1744844 RepID=UPI001AED1B69|nr:GGDEF domain-containing protein [Aureimonas pseudogalii]
MDIQTIGVPAFVVGVDADGSLRMKSINKADEEATGLRLSDVADRLLADCLPTSIVPQVTARYNECIQKRTLHEYDERLEIPGNTRWWRTTLTPIIDATSGRVVELVGVAIEITERKRSEDLLAEVAFQDPLTSIANRRRLEIDVDDAMSAALYTGRRFGLVQIDLDGFKPINDRYGHRKGDDVLRHVASLLKLIARKDETVARIGGDEFAMLIGASTDREFTAKVDALRRFLDRSMSIAEMEVNVGASVGAAMWTGVETFEELLAVADGEMYRQKGCRRSRAA